MNKFCPITKNNKGFGSTEIFIFLVSILILSYIFYFYFKDSFNNAVSLLTSTRPVQNVLLEPINELDEELTEEEIVEEVVDTEPQVEINTDEIKSKIEKLDQEFFSLFTVNNLSNSDSNRVKETITKLRANHEQYDLELKKLDEGAFICTGERRQEYVLREAELNFVRKTPVTPYSNEYWIRDFPRVRLNAERNYVMKCESIYEKHQIKLMEFN